MENPPTRMSLCVPSRFRGWLVRRVCGFLAAWEWKIPAETPGELLVRICSSRRWVGTAGAIPGSQSPRRGQPPILGILFVPGSQVGVILESTKALWSPTRRCWGAPPSHPLPRVQDAASSQDPKSGGDDGSRRRWKEEVCRILGEIQAPLSPLLLRYRSFGEILWDSLWDG